MSMSDPTDLEKKSLEAHVDLCAQRYRFLETKMEAVETQISELRTVTTEVHDMVHAMGTKRSDQLIAWAAGTILFLLSIVGYLLATFVIK
jgi:hypothetical protein